MNKYELALVVSAKVEDEVRNATVEKAKEYITSPVSYTHLPLGTPFKAMDHSYISSLIHLIAVDNFFQNQYKNFTVQYLFQILFSKLKESMSYNNSSTFHEMALQQLHINIASNPSSPWNIPDMAKQLSLIHI